MMTCVSERSGSASSAMRFIDHRPAMTSAAMTVRVMNLFVAQMRISFSIMLMPSAHLRERCFQTRFGIDQKVGLGHDFLSRDQTAAHFVELVRFRSERH